MSIAEDFYYGKQIKTTDNSTGEVRWFHWTEIAGHVVLVTKMQIVGGDYDGQTCYKKLWFDGDLGDKGGETKAWEALSALGYNGDDLLALEAQECWGRPCRFSIYQDSGGYDTVGWIGAQQGSSHVTISRGVDDDARRRFAAQVRARRGGARPPAPAPAPAPAPVTKQPWE